MVKTVKTLLAGAALAMIAAQPAFAAPANSAAKLSVAGATRAGTPTAKKSQLAGTGIIIAVLVVAAVAAAVVVIADGGDKSKSP